MTMPRFNNNHASIVNAAIVRAARVWQWETGRLKSCFRPYFTGASSYFFIADQTDRRLFAG